MSKPVLEPKVEEEVEVGELDCLPSSLVFCLENHQRVNRPHLYGDQTTIKIGEIAFVKNAP